MDNVSEKCMQQIEAARLAMGHGDAAEAERLLTEVIATAERELGADHASLAIPLNELSRLYIKQSDYWHAETILQRLLQIAGAKGDRHPEVATALAGLAVAKRGLGDDAAAEQLYRRALAIREEALAPSHMTIVITLEQLSATCAARGDREEALALLQRALPRRVCALGAEHATVQNLRARIADLERQHRATIASEPMAPSARPMPTPAAPNAAVMTEAPAITATSPEVAPQPSPKRRTARFVWAGAAILTIAGGGMAVSSVNRDRSERAAAEASTEARMSLLASSSAGGEDYTAPLPTRTQPAPPSDAPAAKAVVPVALPNLRKVVVPRIVVPNADSVMRVSAKGTRDVEPELMKVTQNLGAAPSVDEETVTPPVLLGAAPTPHFPDELRGQGIEGEVVVRFRVDDKGRVEKSSMQVVQSRHQLFTAAVRNVLPKLRFEPAHSGQESKPQAAWVQFSTQFASRN